MVMSIRLAVSRAVLSLALAWGGSAMPATCEAATASPPGAVVYFHYPLDRIHVQQRFTVRIGLKEMGVAPAHVDKPFTGHHHLLIDTEAGDLAKPIPSDYNHVHLGNGQTEVVLTLPSGVHTLQLLLGDLEHIPHAPHVISKKITIYVR
jgi:Domain of unknown function (DUF4399)